MFKFLIILFLIGFILVRLIGGVVRLLFGSAANKMQGQQGRPDKSGKVNMNKNTPSRKKEGYSGGEYVDFEEVD